MNSPITATFPFQRLRTVQSLRKARTSSLGNFFQTGPSELFHHDYWSYWEQSVLIFSMKIGRVWSVESSFLWLPQQVLFSKLDGQFLGYTAKKFIGTWKIEDVFNCRWLSNFPEVFQSDLLQPMLIQLLVARFFFWWAAGMVSCEFILGIILICVCKIPDVPTCFVIWACWFWN